MLIREVSATVSLSSFWESGQDFFLAPKEFVINVSGKRREGREEKQSSLELQTAGEPP